jgi:hypothetical protein
MIIRGITLHFSHVGVLANIQWMFIMND